MWDVHKTSFIGGKLSMEDDLCLVSGFNGHKDWIFGGIYDGHGGAETANTAAKEVPKMFQQALKEGSNPEEAFPKVYKEISDQQSKKPMGATALSFLVQDKERMVVANTGDSRMIKVDPKGEIKQLTTDHNLNNEEEKERIKNYGGEIKEGYVFKQGVILAPTRTLGDDHFKDVGVISEPEITILEELPQDVNNYFVAASDGLWQELDNKQVGVLVKKANSSKEAVDKILEFLEKKKGKDFLGQLDNVSIIILKT